MDTNERMIQMNDDLNKAEVDINNLKEQLEHERRVNTVLSQSIEDKDFMYSELTDINVQALKELGYLQSTCNGQKDHIKRLEDRPSTESIQTDLDNANKYIADLQKEVTKSHNRVTQLNLKRIEQNKRINEIIIKLEGMKS